MKISHFTLLSLIILNVGAQASTSLLLQIGKDKTAPFSVGKVERESEEFQQISTDGDSPVRALVFKTVIKLNEEAGIKTATSPNGKVKIEKNTLTVEAETQNAEVILNNPNGKKDSILIKRSYSGTKVFLDGCDKSFPELRTDSKLSENFALGVQCYIRGGRNKAVTISVPTSARILSSSFFDILGKGERWRVYELPSTTQNQQAIGNVLIEVGKSELNFSFISPKSEEEGLQKAVQGLQVENTALKVENKELKTKVMSLAQKNQKLTKAERNYLERIADLLSSVFDVSFGLGVNSLNLDVQESDYGPLQKTSAPISAQMKVESQAFFETYFLDISSTSSLPIAGDEDGLEYFSLDAGGSYLLYDKGSFKVYPKLLMSYRSFMHPKSALAVQVGQLGPGVRVTYDLTKNINKINFQLGTQPLGSSSVKSHFLTALEYVHTFSGNKSWDLGLKLEMNSFSVENVKGQSRNLNSTLFLVQVSL